jgi:MurNAc alpha-1-phosphate uridylyltransferase
LLRDTGGGLIQALPKIGADPFYCVNADNWWVDEGGNALIDMAEAWDAERMDVLMLVVPFERAGNTQGLGDFDMDPDGRLSRGGPRRQRPYVWTGIQMMSKAVVCDPPQDVFSTNIFWDRAIAKGRCYGLVHDGQWYDVGYPAAIGMTEAALAGG